MSLNNIELSPYLVAGLYHKSLVETAMPIPEKQEAKATTTPHIKPGIQSPAFKFLGNNQKSVTIIVDYNDTVHLPDAQLDFLTNLLNACKLGLNDVAVVNINNYKELSHTEILNYFKTNILLLFGLSTAEFGLPFDILQFQVQNFNNITTVHSPALHDLENDKTAKGKLWSSLKKIFNV